MGKVSYQSGLEESKGGVPMGNVFIGLVGLGAALVALMVLLSALRVPACCLQMAGLLVGCVFMLALLAFGVIRV
jgi:hypothetical protein